MKRNKMLLPVIGFIVVLVAGFALAYSTGYIGTPLAGDSMDESMDKSGEVMADKTGGNESMEQDQMSKTGFSGDVLAGDETQYIRFTKADYDKALSEGKAIYLYFYADWCPICKAERPNILAAFNEMNYTDVVGFEVHYRDSVSNAEDDEMARMFGVPYQHTTIILDKNGEEYFRTLSPISKEEIKSKIGEARA